MILNGRQKEWLHSANHDERLVFMAKGPAEVRSYLDENTRDLKHRPALRGVVLGSSGYFDDESEAQARADEILADLQGQDFQDLPVLREEELGIDGTNQMIADQCEEATLNVNQLIHLGALIGSGAGHDGMPDDIHDDLVTALSSVVQNGCGEGAVDAHEAVFLASLPEPLKDELLGNLTDPKSDPTVGETLDDFFQAAIDHGDVGYLAIVSTPVKHYNEDRSAASFSWGSYYTQLLYGESFQELVTQGAQWAEETNEPAPMTKIEATKGSGMSM